MSRLRRLMGTFWALFYLVALFTTFSVYYLVYDACPGRSGIIARRTIPEVHQSQPNTEVAAKSTKRERKVMTTANLFESDVYDKLQRQKVIKVILLAVTPRSGSTYLADILSSPPRTALWQEPLRFLYEKPPSRRRDSQLKLIARNMKKQPPGVVKKDPRFRKFAPPHEKLRMISQFMSCNFSDYYDIMANEHARNFVFKQPEPAMGRSKGRLTPMMFSKVYLKKSRDDCKSTKLRVMKTIRLNIFELIDDLRKGANSTIDPDYKVIMLLRDPRAVLTSLLVSPDYWPSDYTTEDHMCRLINKNLDAIENVELVQSRVKIVKFEDLVEHKEKVVEELYQFLNISYLLRFPYYALEQHKEEDVQPRWDKTLPGEVVRRKKPRIKVRLNPDGTQPFSDFYDQIKDERRRQFFKAKKLNTLLDKGGFRYYSTYRSGNFTHDHWKNEIPSYLLDNIQDKSEQCQKVLARLHYPEHSI